MIRPDPKRKRIKLSAAKRTALKRRLYYGRANEACESCKAKIPLQGSVFYAAHLSHIKSVGAGGDDSEENCKIECHKCHFGHKGHGPRWSSQSPS